VDVHLFAIDDQIHLEITDNGRGAILPEIAKSSFGIVKMQERARNLQGSLEFSSSPGRGTTVLLSLPLSARVTARSGA
jgi:signal transduction histidine kinase